MRICTEPYQAPDARNLGNARMHLTNYAINKDSDKFRAAASNGYSPDEDDVVVSWEWGGWRYCS